ncbi:hypothetical protein VIGAN_UM156300, partial [Vigna angularis var. angularis]
RFCSSSLIYRLKTLIKKMHEPNKMKMTIGIQQHQIKVHQIKVKLLHSTVTTFTLLISFFQNENVPSQKDN